MVASAVEFEARIDDDWKISIPYEYRDYFSNLTSVAKVIVLNEEVGLVNQSKKTISISEFDKKYPEYQEFIDDIAEEYLYA